ncbi:hypothetical protein BGX31_000341 [Mortierella sp. GBA43]|nr:hypothetical protein BGX31_000341 [Mortierella sp. GBA43]
MPSSTSSTSSTSTPIAKPKPTITAPTKISTYKVRLDITSDSTCPWCFITKRRISKAIAMFHSLSEEASRVRFDIHWHPYQLDPRAPKEPIPKSKLYTRKFGPERAVLVRDRVMAVGKLEGIEFLKAEDCWYCSTIDSHRLIRYARHKMGRTLFDTSSLINNKNSNPTTIINRDLCDNKDKDKDTDADSGIHSDLDDPEDEDMDVFGNMMEDAMVDELFQSHFERGETGDLASLKRSARLVLQQFADIENARSAAAASGNQDPIVVVDDEAINKEMAEIEQYMDSDQGLAEVKEEIRVAKQDMGFQGVPSIIVQNTYLLSGGQDSTVFVEIFKRVV